jgi:hypothetical protein
VRSTDLRKGEDEDALVQIAATSMECLIDPSTSPKHGEVISQQATAAATIGLAVS